MGRYVKLTFEPHDPSCAGLFIRQVLMKKIANIPTKTLALAFAANRADHCDREIQPFLQQVNGKNRVLICDRYYLSSLVYQSTPDFGFEEVMALNSSAVTPDLTIFLTASSKTCYTRMRIRGDEKELFEVNLNDTRNKYLEAVDFLRLRGENVVVVEAEGTIEEVFDRVKEAIFDNSPDWLRFQYQLPFSEADNVFDQKGVTINSIADSISADDVMLQACANEFSIREKIRKFVDDLAFDDAASLFLDFLSCNSYVLHGKLPWTDLDAFELECNLPLGVVQRGAALLLGESQRYDVVLTKLLGSAKFHSIEQMSDFLFIFDSNPCHLRVNYYEREKVAASAKQKLSPTLVVVGRAELADYLSDVLLTRLANGGIREDS